MKELLLIDDDESTLLLASKYLNKSGYKTLLAKNGEEAFEVLKNQDTIELIVVDVVMPVMDGVQFCRLVRADKKFNRLPVLMLTAMSDITDKYVGFDAGADDYLTKPFEPLELLLRVQALLKRANYNINPENNDSKVNIEINVKRIIPITMIKVI